MTAIPVPRESSEIEKDRTLVDSHCTPVMVRSMRQTQSTSRITPLNRTSHRRPRVASWRMRLHVREHCCYFRWIESVELVRGVIWIWVVHCGGRERCRCGCGDVERGRGRGGENAQLTWPSLTTFFCSAITDPRDKNEQCQSAQRTTTIAPKPWSGRKLSDTTAGTSTHVARRSTRPHRRMTAH